MIWPFRKKSAKKKAVTRTRIFASALLLCGIMGALQVTLPLEDVFRGGRNLLRARPADKSVVIVAIDDRTEAKYGSDRYSRGYNAALLDTLFANGAKRVYFDEVFSEPSDSEGDARFAAALRKYKGRVFTGSISVPVRSTGTVDHVFPAPIFRDKTTLRSLNGSITPFSFSAELFYVDEIGSKKIPTISADIAAFSGPAGVRYRPDWAIQAKSVPTLSLVDAISGSFDPTQVRGKDIIVGVVNNHSKDYVQIVGQQWVAGVYVHAVGAQTLKEGRPVHIGFLPPLLAGGILSLVLLRARKRRQWALILTIAALAALVVPFVLDVWFVSADFIPAFLMFGIIAYRSATLRVLAEARLTNAGSLLPTVSALREEPDAPNRSIIAMRIRNYAAVCSSFNTPVEDELITELARRLTVPNDPTPLYQAEDVLYWLAPSQSQEELEEHLAGLARLIESHFEIRGRKLDIHVAFGVEADLSRPVPNRIGRALLAADNAASKHKLMHFSTGGNDEDTAWELSLMSELDEAIDAGDIWIAYQPQFDLRDDSVTGAEALVRWQHPTRGAISPEAFVLSAEAHNRIGRLTFHILEHATRSAKHILETKPDFRLSVNISANLLGLPQLPAQIAQVLIRTGFPASNLTLEVTESAPFSSRTVVAANLNGIAAIGIDLSIDDYGTGNATLEYLRSVPCQEIKIDRRFVGGLATNASDLLLVESTIELAHGLGRRVIAEGIEDPETLEMLRTIGCDIAQGYYLAKPMRLDALTTLLEAEVRTKAA